MSSTDPNTPGPNSAFGDPSPSYMPAFLQPALSQYMKVSRQYQALLDRSAPHTLQRWAGTAGLVFIFLMRIVFAQGVMVHRLVVHVIEVGSDLIAALGAFFLLVCYAHAIYLLNLLLAFLQPRFDPSLEADLTADELEEGGPDEYVLPSQQQKDDEFRPFIRRLPEWNFWLSTTRATVISIFCTMFEIFDVPVYWPILVGYFLALFAMTMRRQIQHMIKYKYVPFDIGRKTRYGNSPR
ncbi:retrieval of early ER protein Rer1 [Hysterangium stoloniferum]|nr:retrieval of early ER protein Rer1 [Hysterangium stoloniferum]